MARTHSPPHKGTAALSTTFTFKHNGLGAAPPHPAGRAVDTKRRSAKTRSRGAAAVTMH